MLTHRSHEPEFRNRGDALLAALSGLAVEAPRSVAYVLRGADMMRRGEVGPVQYFAKGKVRVETKIDKDNARAIVSLQIAPGWHINSKKPLNEDFIPTKLEVVNKKMLGGAVQYPVDVVRKLKFNDGDMALYEGNVDIIAPLSKNVGDSLNLKLTLQACSDEICLEPVEGELLVR